LGLICGMRVDRKRNAEFAAWGKSNEQIKTIWEELKKKIINDKEQIPIEVMERELKHPRRGKICIRELLLIIARHAAEHVGHAELSRDMLFLEKGKIPPIREY
jgi:hypothetical protein